jgi:hypothetical protein
MAGGLKFSQIRLDDDGPPFLHVLANIELLNDGEPTTEFLNSSEVIAAQQCQLSIQNLYWNGTLGAGAMRGILEPIRLPVSRDIYS